MFVGRAHERLEQRMRLERLRLELGMELASDEVRMIGNFDHLDVSSVRRRAGNPQAGRGQRVFVFAIEFVAMAMALADFGLAVNLVGQSVRARSCRSMRPAAWCRRVLPRRAVRAVCRSRDAALRDRIRWSWRPPVRRRCARTRCTRSACPGKCRSTELYFRARSGSPSTCLRCRACRSRRAPECRRSPASCSSQARCPVFQSFGFNPVHAAVSDCAPARRGPAPLSATCRNLRIRRTCRRCQS